MVPVETARFARRLDEELWRVVPVDDVAVGLSFGARVFGIDPEDGAVLWREGPFGDQAGLWASPEPAPGAALVRTGLRTFRAYDVRRGTPYWETAIEVASPDEHVFLLPLPSGLVVSCGATLEMLEWKERDLRWSLDLDGGPAVRLWSADADRLLVEGRSTIHAVRPTDGVPLWVRGFSMVRRLVVSAGQLVVLDRTRLVVVDLGTGEVVDERPVAEADGEGWGWPVEVGGEICWPVVDRDGSSRLTFWAWSKSGLRETRRVPLPAPALGRPVHAAPYLYVPLTDATILEMDAQGKPHRSLKTGLTPPAEGSWAAHEAYLVPVGPQRLFYFQDFLAGW